MLTIDLIQESVDVTGYQNILADSIAIPIVLVLALAMTVIITYLHNAYVSEKSADRGYYEPGDASVGCITMLFTLAGSILVFSIPAVILGTHIENVPRGDNSFYDRISYVAYDTAPFESKHKTLKEDFHDEIKEEINEKKNDLEKYGLDSDACESHKRSTTDVSMLCGGDSVTDVRTLSHNIHIAIGNTTERSKDNMPRNHVEVKDGEELFWASLVINNS